MNACIYWWYIRGRFAVLSVLSRRTLCVCLPQAVVFVTAPCPVIVSRLISSIEYCISWGWICQMCDLPCLGGWCSCLARQTKTTAAMTEEKTWHGHDMAWRDVTWHGMIWPVFCIVLSCHCLPRTISFFFCLLANLSSRFFYAKTSHNANNIDKCIFLFSPFFDKCLFFVVCRSSRHCCVATRPRFTPPITR